MTHVEIRNEIGRLIKCERENTNEILAILKKAEDEKSYRAFDYASLYDWLLGDFKYSEQSALRRLEAVRLMREVPHVQERLEEGALNLTTLNKAQWIIKAQERATGTKISPEEKVEAVKEIEGLSAAQAEEALFERFPEAQPEVNKPKKQRMKNGMTRHHFNFNAEEEAEFDRAKQLLSHQIPIGDEAKVLIHALRYLLAKKDPLQQELTTAEENRIANGTPSKAHIHRATIQSSQGTCTYVDVRGKVCGSTFQIQQDHIIPTGIGGENTLEN